MAERSGSIKKRERQQSLSEEDAAVWREVEVSPTPQPPATTATEPQNVHGSTHSNNNASNNDKNLNSRVSSTIKHHDHATQISNVREHFEQYQRALRRNNYIKHIVYIVLLTIYAITAVVATVYSYSYNNYFYKLYWKDAFRITYHYLTTHTTATVTYVLLLVLYNAFAIRFLCAESRQQRQWLWSHNEAESIRSLFPISLPTAEGNTTPDNSASHNNNAHNKPHRRNIFARSTRFLSKHVSNVFTGGLQRLGFIITLDPADAAATRAQALEQKLFVEDVVVATLVVLLVGLAFAALQGMYYLCGVLLWCWQEDIGEPFLLLLFKVVVVLYCL